MIVTIFIGLDHVNQKAGKIVSISRSSDLVADHSQLIVSFSHLKHCFYKVIPIFSKYPCNTDDKIFRQCIGNCQLSA